MPRTAGMDTEGLPQPAGHAWLRDRLDLTALVAALRRIPAKDLEASVSSEPTGAYARRAWFLYETFLGEPLDLPDAIVGNYTFALDPGRHLVAPRRNGKRHRVADNLLGDARFCPIVRRTPELADAMAWDLDARARDVVRAVDPALLARAVRYLYTRETRSSFAIERETPSSNREERFVQALVHARDLDSTPRRRDATTQPRATMRPCPNCLATQPLRRKTVATDGRSGARRAARARRLPTADRASRRHLGTQR